MTVGQQEVWTDAEVRGGKLESSTAELACKGRQLTKSQRNLCALLVGDKVSHLADELFNMGCDDVLLIESSNLRYFDPHIYADAVAEAIRDLKPVSILFPQTLVSADLAATLSGRLDLPFASNCIEMVVENDEMLMIRQEYKGKILAKVKAIDKQPLLVSFVPGSLKVEALTTAPRGSIHTLNYGVAAKNTKIRVLNETVDEYGEDVDIVKADVVVAGGLGLNKEDFATLEELARALGGVVACSRPIVEKGWLPHARQVGLSGKSIKPKLYIACGISGASEHLVGMRNSSIIIAINKDPHAPIFDNADYRIVADIHEILPSLLDEVKSVSSKI